MVSLRFVRRIRRVASGSATLVALLHAKVHSPSLSVEERYASPKITLEEAQFERFYVWNLACSRGASN